MPVTHAINCPTVQPNTVHQIVKKYCLQNMRNNLLTKKAPKYKIKL